MTEQELVTGCKKHDIASQGALYERYAGVLFGICLRYCKNKADAEDLLQEVFIRIFDQIKSFKGTGSLEGWMKITCIRQALNFLRKEKRKNTEPWNDRDAQSIPHPFAKEDLLRSLQTLTDNERMVFNLREIEGYPYEEIEQLTRLSCSQARVCLYRARKKLQAYWKNELG